MPQTADSQPTPFLVLIAATSENNVIGLEGDLPWSLPRDLAHFKRVTMGHAIIMGRKTWDQVGKPLPGRRNIVITRQADWSAPGAEVVHTLEDAIALAEQGAPGDTHMIIGGGQIYRMALPLASRIELTRIHAHIEGDTTFPEIGSDWELVSRRDCDADEANVHAMSFLTYERA